MRNSTMKSKCNNSWNHNSYFDRTTLQVPSNELTTVHRYMHTYLFHYENKIGQFSWQMSKEQAWRKHVSYNNNNNIQINKYLYLLWVKAQCLTWWNDKMCWGVKKTQKITVMCACVCIFVAHSALYHNYFYIYIFYTSAKNKKYLLSNLINFRECCKSTPTLTHTHI